MSYIHVRPNYNEIEITDAYYEDMYFRTEISPTIEA